MAKLTVIGSHEFRTKGEAKQFYGSIRDRYLDGVALLPEDHTLLRELLACHPEASGKIGAGVAYFTVDTDSHYGTTRHFTVHRVDGTHTDFSYHTCIDGRNERRDRLGALREAVQNQIVSFRECMFASHVLLVCPLRRVPITREAYHVDHMPPADFDVLVQGWLNAGQITLESVQITPPSDNQIVAVMTDAVQKTSWQEYHRKHAQLRLLSPRGNLSEARRS